MGQALDLQQEVWLSFAITLSALNPPPFQIGFPVTRGPQLFHKALLLDLGKDSHDGDHALGHFVGVFSKR
jgi:hypothetical protein